jgi:sulfur relay (sulfurtransferase) DsrC/TusE family protein
MMTKELTVALDAEGFMTNPKEWTPEIAEAMAALRKASPR